jgi:hypothetical protein
MEIVKNMTRTYFIPEKRMPGYCRVPDLNSFFPEMSNPTNP